MKKVRALAERSETTLLLRGLTPSTLYEVRVETLSLSGETTVMETQVTTHAPLPRLTITEALADPLGPDPDQEYVEVLNYGDLPLPLAAQPHRRHANAATVDEGPWPISYRRPPAACSGRRCRGVTPHAKGVTAVFALAR